MGRKSIESHGTFPEEVLFVSGEGWRRKPFKKLVVSLGQNDRGLFLCEV